MANTPLRIDLWDVGQGDCSVITTSSGELIIIDTGPIGSPLIPWITKHQSLRIYAIILTHNDKDHVGALTPLLESTIGRVGKIFALFEPQRSKEEFRAIFRRAFELHTAGKIVFDRLESPELIWSDPDNGTELRVVFPDTVDIETASSINRSSAILELVANNNTIAVWPGDNTITRTAAKTSLGPACLLHGPHHGAPQDIKSKSFDNALRQICPAHVFVSVGTNNQPGHPRKDYVRKLVSMKSQIACSQLTLQCDRKKCLSKEPVLDSASRLGLWPTPGVPCRGCMRFTLSNGTLHADSYVAEHQRRISKLHSRMCQ